MAQKRNLQGSLWLSRNCLIPLFPSKHLIANAKVFLNDNGAGKFAIKFPFGPFSQVCLALQHKNCGREFRSLFIIFNAALPEIINVAPYIPHFDGTHCRKLWRNFHFTIVLTLQRIINMNRRQFVFLARTCLY